MTDRSRGWRVARHPLLHFVLIGAALFALYTWRNGSDESGSTRIDINRGRINWLAGTFAAQFGHAPDRAELDSLVKAFVTDEMSYREAMSLGLDQDDSIVRRRMIQKYEFLTLEEEPPVPSDAALRAYFTRHAARYAQPALVSLCQVYVVAVPDRGAALARVRRIGAALQAGRADPVTVGDPIDLPPCATEADRPALQRAFGSFFAEIAQRLPTGSWIAPVESGYGLHAVRVSARKPAPSRFEDRRDEVRDDWMKEQRGRLRTDRMQRLRARYDVVIDGTAMREVAAAAVTRLWFWLALVTVFVGSTPASAHEIRPISLELREAAPERYAARFKVPAVEERFLAVRPVFARSCRVHGDPLPRLAGASAVARFQLICARSLAGTTIAFENLERTMIDGTVTVTWRNGQAVTRRVRPTEPSLTVPRTVGPAEVLRDYVVLGVEHILLGPDHLLFVLSLVLLVAGWRRLLVTATAFTLAHSITLSLAALGIVHVPVPPMEALIALSILYMALELAAKMRSDDQLHARPWLLAFAFGLLHGLGFASALSEVGLPNHQIPVALLGFNVGVELGQLAFILVVLALLGVVRRLAARLSRPLHWLATYAIGGMASFWVIDRVTGF